jgi:hypothetical protein
MFIKIDIETNVCLYQNNGIALVKFVFQNRAKGRLSNEMAIVIGEKGDEMGKFKGNMPNYELLRAGRPGRSLPDV